VRIFLTGGAGFIGSNLAERLLDDGHEVTAHDDLSLGRREFLSACERRAGFRFVKGDLLHREEVADLLRGHEAVFHMAANSDIAAGGRATDTDLRQGTLATYHVLDGMRRAGVRELVFASSSAVYGEPRVAPTPEDYGPLLPISLYGASKLACEGLISAFEHAFGIQAWIFRFANVVGEHGTHGAVVDFLRKLRADPASLEILGDGRQAKPYLHVRECVDGMLFGWAHARERVNCFNLACEGATSATRIAEIVCEEMGLESVRFRYTGGSRGWVGDVPQVRLDPARLAALGWTARLASDEAVRLAVRALLAEAAGVGAGGSR
jgi:UDP-glucose 4-epimerase